jgi:hypothetical protein
MFLREWGGGGAGLSPVGVPRVPRATLTETLQVA